MEVTDQHIKKYNDLKIQAMLFDMDIDIETWSLVEKHKDETPAWLKRWKDKNDASDTRIYDHEH